MGSGTLERTKRARFAVGAAATSAIAAAIVAWRMPWNTSYELAAHIETIPSSAPLTSLWSNEDGTRVVAVGPKGAVFERVADLGDVRGTWRRTESNTTSDLLGVGGGDGPWRHPVWPFGEGHHLRVFAVGSGGAIVDCTSSQCASVQSSMTRDLRDVAVAGGQAIAVGVDGAVVHVAADPTPRVPIPETSLKTEPVTVSGLSSTLNAVLLECVDNNRWPDCLAVAVGDRGVIVEGAGKGRCDEGHPATEGCVWTWRIVPGALAGRLRSVWRDAEGIVASDEAGARERRDTSGTWRAAEQVDGTWREIDVPVRTVRRKLGVTRESTGVALTAFGSRAFVNRSSSWLPLRIDGSIQGASIPALEHGELAFLLLSDGRVEVAASR